MLENVRLLPVEAWACRHFERVISARPGKDFPGGRGGKRKKARRQRYGMVAGASGGNLRGELIDYTWSSATPGADRK